MLMITWLLNQIQIGPLRKLNQVGKVENSCLLGGPCTLNENENNNDVRLSNTLFSKEVR